MIRLIKKFYPKPDMLQTMRHIRNTPAVDTELHEAIKQRMKSEEEALQKIMDSIPIEEQEKSKKEWDALSPEEQRNFRVQIRDKIFTSRMMEAAQRMEEEKNFPFLAKVQGPERKRFVLTAMGVDVDYHHKLLTDEEKSLEAFTRKMAAPQVFADFSKNIWLDNRRNREEKEYKKHGRAREAVAVWREMLLDMFSKNRGNGYLSQLDHWIFKHAYTRKDKLTLVDTEFSDEEKKRYNDEVEAWPKKSEQKHEELVGKLSPAVAAEMMRVKDRNPEEFQRVQELHAIQLEIFQYIMDQAEYYAQFNSQENESLYSAIYALKNSGGDQRLIAYSVYASVMQKFLDQVEAEEPESTYYAHLLAIVGVVIAGLAVGRLVSDEEKMTSFYTHILTALSSDSAWESTPDLTSNMSFLPDLSQMDDFLIARGPQILTAAISIPSQHPALLKSGVLQWALSHLADDNNADVSLDILTGFASYGSKRARSFMRQSGIVDTLMSCATDANFPRSDRACTVLCRLTEFEEERQLLSSKGFTQLIISKMSSANKKFSVELVYALANLSQDAPARLEMLRSNRALFPLVDRLGLIGSDIERFYSCVIMSNLGKVRSARLGNEQMDLLEEYKVEAPEFKSYEILNVKAIGASAAIGLGGGVLARLLFQKSATAVALATTVWASTLMLGGEVTRNAKNRQEDPRTRDMVGAIGAAATPFVLAAVPLMVPSAFLPILASSYLGLKHYKHPISRETYQL